MEANQTVPRVKSMDDIWNDAAKEFHKLCKKSLQTGRVKSFADVRRAIDICHLDPSGDEEQKVSGWAKAKNYGLETLDLLTGLLGIAAQVTAVFPLPLAAASIVCSALAFVFNIPGAIKGYEDAINHVFTFVHAGLSQFRIFSSIEDLSSRPELLHHIHQVMISFVKLCAHVVKYHQGGKHQVWQKFTAAILNDDSGLAVEMENFTEMLHRQSQVVGAETLATVIESQEAALATLEAVVRFGDITEATYEIVQEVGKDVKDMLSIIDPIQVFRVIHKALGLSPDTSIDTEAPHMYKESYNKLGDFSATACSWIWKCASYKTWTAPREQVHDGSHVLILEGAPSSGKTTVSSLITHRLGHGRSQKGLVHVAHYFFSAEQKKAGFENPGRTVLSSSKKENADTSLLDAALKFMAFQIARSDEKLQQALYATCKSNPDKFDDAADLVELWRALSIGANGSAPTYYLIFDGIEKLPPAQATLLLDFILGPHLAGKVNGQVRVLVSGAAETFNSHGKIPEGVCRIDLHQYNSEDMKDYIGHTLNQHWDLHPAGSSFEQSQSPDTQSHSQHHARSLSGPPREQARDLILSKLPESSNGSYTLLQFGLDTVVNLLSTRTAGIKQLEALFTQSLSNHRQMAILKLQRSLEAHEITELNELLTWVLYARQAVSLDLLEATMSLLAGPGSIRLSSLKATIPQKYSAILAIEDDHVLLQEGVEPFVQAKIRSTARDADDIPSETEAEMESTISMTITLKNVDRKICAEFFWDLAHKTFREQFKYGFFSANGASSSSSATEGLDGSIGVDKFDAHHTIVKQAFDYLQGAHISDMQELGRYLVCWLPWHLELLRDDDNEIVLNPHQQEEIGMSLYVLFRDDQVLKRHQDSFSATYWTPEEIRYLQNWVVDSTYVMGLVKKPAPKKWRTRVKNAADKSPIVGFLSVWAKRMVENFLQSKSWPVDNAHDWIESFMLSDHEDISASLANEAEYDDKTPPYIPPTLDNRHARRDLEYWKRVSQWCRNLLGGDSLVTGTSLWWQRLADAAAENWRYDRVDAVLALYKHSVEIGNPHWTCHRSLAKIYFNRNQFLEALAQFESALDSTELTDEERKELRLFAARCSSAVGDSAKEKLYYVSTLENEDHVQARTAQLEYFKMSLKKDDAQVFLKTEMTREGGEKRVLEILKTSTSDIDHGRTVRRIFHVLRDDRSLLEQLVKVMQQATVQLDRSDASIVDVETRGTLLNDLAMAAFYYQVTPPTASENDYPGEAAQFWQHCVTSLSKPSTFNVKMVLQNAITCLAKHWFHLMLPRHTMDHVDKLSDLARRETVYFLNPAAAYLAVIYALNNEREKSQTQFRARIEKALRILTDDTPHNDEEGFSVLTRALHCHQDFRNAAIALCLVGKPDLLTQTLRSRSQGIEDEICAGKLPGEVLDFFNTVAEEVVRTVESQHPAEAQKERIKAAVVYCQQLPGAPTPTLNPPSSAAANDTAITAAPCGELGVLAQPEESLDRTIADENIDNPKATAYRALHEVISSLDQIDSETLEYMYAYWLPMECDGCHRDSDFSTTLYHCVYCPDVDFCSDCLPKLLQADRAAGVIEVCSPMHKWFKVPKQGSDMYVGYTAKMVRIPSIRTAPEGPHVIEAYYEGDEHERRLKVGDEISVEEWKKDLAREWGISLEDLN